MKEGQMSELTRQSSPDGTLVFRWKTGYAQIKRMGPGIIFFRQVGYFPAHTFSELVKPFDDEAKKVGKLTMICDCDKMQSYEPNYRELWQNWFKAQSQRGGVIAYVSLKSPLVRLGVRMVNLVVRVFEVHENSTAMVAAAAKAVNGFIVRAVPSPLVEPAAAP
jgi:hypothetical protein